MNNTSLNFEFTVNRPQVLFGKDGVSPVVEVTNIEGGHRLTITDALGVHAFDIMDGERGQTGATGADGIDGATPYIGGNGNWYFGDFDTGFPSRGAQGERGANGTNGRDGIDGAPGAKGDKGDKGDDGQDGAQGERGERGYSGLVPKVVTPYAPTIMVPANTMTEIATLTGAITITLGDGVEGYDNEWDFVIVQGATAQTITLPTVVWGMGIAPTFSANSATIVRLYYIGGTLRGEWCV